MNSRVKFALRLLESEPDTTTFLCGTCKYCQTIHTRETHDPEHESLIGIHCAVCDSELYPALYCEEYEMCKKGEEPAYLTEGLTDEQIARIREAAEQCTR